MKGTALMSGTIVQSQSAARALLESPILVLRGIEVNETESEVTIAGLVHSYYFKQLAQETVRPVLGNRKLVNHIAVDPQA
jgi:hypothetical protein